MPAGRSPAPVARLLVPVLAGLLALLLAGCGIATPTLAPPGPAANASAAGCRGPSPTAPGAAESGLPVRSLCALPPEAGQVWRTISTGGRPAYPKDGTIFRNAERLLPRHRRDYYREYTVPTPGSRDRGARRLVTGQGRELYYTADHYDSFVVVDPTAVGS